MEPKIERRVRMRNLTIITRVSTARRLMEAQKIRSRQSLGNTNSEIKTKPTTTSDVLLTTLRGVDRARNVIKAEKIMIRRVMITRLLHYICRMLRERLE